MPKSSVHKPGLAEREGMMLSEGSVQFRSEKKNSKRDIGIPKNTDRGDGGYDVERRVIGLVHPSGVDIRLKRGVGCTA